MLLLLLFAFIGGVVTILSPCILPILPIVLSGSVTGGKRRPLGIVTGFIAGFTLFTLFLTAIVNASGISPDALRTLSVVLIGFFGVSLLIPKIQLLIEKAFSKLASLVPNAKGEGFSGGILIGLSLGLIWTPCVGPILASVISLALTEQVTGSAFLITLAYSLGTAIPMLAIMYGGRTLLNRLPVLTNNTEKIQKAFGVLMIITALAIQFNIDRKFQTYILEKFPNYGTGLTAFEDNDAVQKALDRQMNIEEAKKLNYEPAPEIILGGEWLNSEALSLAELKGQKVVMIDFMTYSCINCIRTFPYLNDWWEKYEDDGLVIIGIHTPEFEFEKNSANVAKALRDFDIKFPVMQDNNYETWRAYGNRYWPRKYLIDINGDVVYDHIGEGAYETTEEKIKELLLERKRALEEELEISGGSSVQIDDPALMPGRSGSPEVYFGASRNELLGNGDSGVVGLQNFILPADIRKNNLYFSGDWKIEKEFSQPTQTGNKIVFRYQAKQVFMVAGSDKLAKVKITLNGEDLNNKNGKDVNDLGEMIINEQKLYHLISSQNVEENVLEITILEGNPEIFTFTFG